MSDIFSNDLGNWEKKELIWRRSKMKNSIGMILNLKSFTKIIFAISSNNIWNIDL